MKLSTHDVMVVTSEHTRGREGRKGGREGGGGRGEGGRERRGKGRERGGGGREGGKEGDNIVDDVKRKKGVNLPDTSPRLPVPYSNGLIIRRANYPGVLLWPCNQE